MAALAGLKVTPFGDNSLAISDGNALYLNYMGYVSQVLKGQEGILFSFSKGIGGNMMGSWGWFLLNPYFALFAFTDVINYMQTFTFVSLLNFCTCGLTMYILLKDTYGHKGSNLIFSTAYALNGFLVANVFQMNFFAVIPVLPIMVLGLRRILKDQNPVVYILSIAYGLLMNFYFGFMLCVASFLFFVVFYIAYRNEMPNKKSVLLKYIFSSLLGGAISSVVWLPAILSLRGGRLDQSIASAITFEENMPFLDMFTKLFTGANSTAELSNGLPNIFVGILPVFLVIVFFMNKKIKRQERIAFAVLLLAYLISFYIGVINIFMHGGTTTNWFNYRDSFVFCFLMLMVAAEEWEHITDEPRENLKRTLIILIIGTLIVFSKRFEFLSGGMVLIDFAVLGLMILAYFMHKKDPEKNPKRIFTMVILLLMCVNLFLNYSFSTKNIMDWSHEEGEYQKIVMPVSAMVEAVQNSDDSFYRMEIGEQRSGSTGNDPMLYGYYGVGHGGSDDRNFVRTALSELGVHRFDMRNSYGRGIPSATDNLLGLKYIISKENLTEEKGYEALINLGDWAIYKNQYALPIAMLVDEGAADVTIDLEDVFDNLNRTWSAMTGTESQIFTEESDVVFSSHNVTDSRELRQEQAKIITASRDASISAMASSNESSQGRSDEGLLEGASESETKTKDNPTRGTFQEKPENTNYIQYTFTASRDGAVYSYNRSGMTESQGSMLPSLNYEGYYHIGDTVTGYLPVYGTLVSEYMLEEVAGRFRVAYADADALAEMSQTILDRPSAIEKVKDSHLRGEFTAEAGQMLMFTIPYDEGWTLTVDGQETEIKQVLGVFMAAEVDPGEHTYEMKFVPSGLKIGAVVATISALLIVGYVLFDRKRHGRGPTAGIQQEKKPLMDAVEEPIALVVSEDETPIEEVVSVPDAPENEPAVEDETIVPDIMGNDPPSEEAVTDSGTERINTADSVKEKLRWKHLTKMFFLPASMGLIGILLLTLSFMLPLSKIRDNVAASVQTLLTESARFSSTPSDPGSILDNWTDAVYLNEALIGTDMVSPLDGALSGYIVTCDGADQPTDLLAMVFEKEELSLNPYENRFFNGYMLPLKLLLEFTDYSGIRALNWVVMSLLFMALCALMLKRKLGAYILPITVSILLLRPIALAMSMAYAGFFYCMIIPCLIMLKANEKLKNGWRYALFFEGIGCCTFFFNMNYFQLLTFAFPFMFYLLLNGFPEKAVDMLKIGAALFASWAFGYYGMMLIKWVAYAVLLDRPEIFTEMWELIMFRTSQTDMYSAPISRLSAIVTNLYTAFSNEWWNLSELWLIVYQFVLIRKVHTVRKVKSGELLLLLVMLLLPFIRYIIFANHVFIHGFTMFRLMMIPILTINVLLVYMRKTGQESDEPIETPVSAKIEIV